MIMRLIRLIMEVTECPICNELLHINFLLTTRCCNQSLHKECFDKSLISTKGTCPFCRSTTTTTNITNITNITKITNINISNDTIIDNNLIIVNYYNIIIIIIELINVAVVL